MATAVFAVTLAFRLLDPFFDDDHFRMITQGRQVEAFGELPIRDFDDPGIFLQIFTSAALQRMFGYNLLGQALFDVLILAAAAALTFWLAARASGSVLLALAVTTLAVLMYPRLKQHHVVFLPLLGLTICWAYAVCSTRRRLLLLGITTALAFLLRHDLGIYLALAATATLLAAHWAEGLRVLLRRVTVYAFATILSLMPFFVFLEVSGGVVPYFRAALDYVRSEAERQRAFDLPLFFLDRSAPFLAVQPGPVAQVRVRWDDSVTAEDRLALERKYRLVNPRQDASDSRQMTWKYDLLDASRENLRALVRDRRVEDTDGIDRRTYETRDAAGPFFLEWFRGVPFFWVRVGPNLIHASNALPWLYYLFVAVTLLSTLNLGWAHLRGRPVPESPQILGAVVLAAVAQPAIRAPLNERLADAAAPIAILSAWLLGRWLRGSLPRASHVSTPRAPMRWQLLTGSLRAVAALVLLGLTWASIATLPEIGSRLQQASISNPTDLFRRAARVVNDLSASPTSTTVGLPRGQHEFVEYLRACTTPEQRVLTTWFEPHLYFGSGRGFAGRQLFWFRGYASSEEEQERTLEKMRSQSVPIILDRLDVHDGIRLFPIVQMYVSEHYRVAWEPEPSVREGRRYRVLVDRRLTPRSAYGPVNLPCYQS